MDDSREAIRAFVALDLEPMSLRRLARIADRLRMGSGAPSAKWTPPGRMHVTLRFIATLPVALIAPLGAALRPLAEGKGTPAGSWLVRLDAFPAADQALVVVAELLDEKGRLTKLAERVDRTARKLGLAPADQPFRPHVTLARLRRPYDARRWLRPELAEGAECRMVGLTLFRSETGSDGSIYVPLAQFAFGERAF